MHGLPDHPRIIAVQCLYQCYRQGPFAQTLLLQTLPSVLKPKDRHTRMLSSTIIFELVTRSTLQMIQALSLEMCR